MPMEKQEAAKEEDDEQKKMDKAKDEEKENEEEKLLKEKMVKEEKARASRRLLSTSASVPAWLRERFDMRADVQVVHVQHADNLLPHFQVKLPAGEQHLGRYQT